MNLSNQILKELEIIMVKLNGIKLIDIPNDSFQICKRELPFYEQTIESIKIRERASLMAKKLFSPWKLTSIGSLGKFTISSDNSIASLNIETRNKVGTDYLDTNFEILSCSIEFNLNEFDTYTKNAFNTFIDKSGIYDVLSEPQVSVKDVQRVILEVDNAFRNTKMFVSSVYESCNKTKFIITRLFRFSLHCLQGKIKCLIRASSRSSILL
ncbi:hypothetical protein ACOME3_001581 [Neoechinorhynchus agilis]